MRLWALACVYGGVGSSKGEGVAVCGAGRSESAGCGRGEPETLPKGRIPGEEGFMPRNSRTPSQLGRLALAAVGRRWAAGGPGRRPSLL